MQHRNLAEAAVSVAINNKHQLRRQHRSRTATGHSILSPSPNSWLSATEIALDRTAMTAYLAPRLTPITPSGTKWTVTDLELLDYKPGQRGLIRYELATEQGDERQIVFGKLYADRGQLTRIDQVLHTLWADVFCADRHYSVPQPLGVIPELAMLVYLPAEGQFLDEVISDERAGYAIELTAHWLGMLHRHPVQVDKQFHLAGELVNLSAWATVVSETYPALADLAQQALVYLQQQAANLPLDTQTPIHKDFHYRHVLVERGVKVIDFDELRLGDPNFDLAHFCANLDLLAYRQSGSPYHLHKLEQRFLDAYARTTGWNWTKHKSRFVYFYVYTCLKLARQLCLGFGPSPVPTGEERQRQVKMILSQVRVVIG